MVRIVCLIDLNKDLLKNVGLLSINQLIVAKISALVFPHLLLHLLMIHLNHRR